MSITVAQTQNKKTKEAALPRDLSTA